jgi:hypothetical protein
MTRTIPSRAASWVATVDFPTPVAPPITITSGTSSAVTSCHRTKFCAYRSPATSSSIAAVSSRSSAEVIEVTPRSTRSSSMRSATWYER